MSRDNEVIKVINQDALGQALIRAEEVRQMMADEGMQLDTITIYALIEAAYEVVMKQKQDNS